jgi:hypothetical protein
MTRGISPKLLKLIRIKNFYAAVENWFRNKNRIFNTKNYNKDQKAHNKWEGENNIRIFEYQFHYRNTEYIYGSEFSKSKKNVYFLNKLSIHSLNKILASVNKIRYIDNLFIIVRTASCNRRYENNRSLSGERTENEKSTLKENKKVWSN